jgi:hypothetical protein
MNSTVCLRYIGVIPKVECLEYGFRIEEKDKDPRLVVLLIESILFKKHDLLRQEAPDLCYQKLLAALRSETSEEPISPCLPITASDIADYRGTHPIGKASKPRSGTFLQ